MVASTAAESSSSSSATAPLSVLIALSIALRLFAPLTLRFGGFFADNRDFQYYHQISALSAQGFFPDIQYWVEYPPIFPWLAVGIYKLSLLLPPWPQPAFWFYLVLSVVLGLADVGSLCLVDSLGDDLWGPGQGRRCTVLYALLFMPFFAALNWFDALPTFLLLLGLWLALRQRAAPAGLVTALGVLTKLFPLVVLPSAFIALRTWRARLAMLLGFALVLAAVSAPFLIVSPQTYLSSFRNVLARGSWESPWALIDGYFGSGVVASPSDRLYFNASALWGAPSHSGTIWLIAAAIAAALYLWLARRLWIEARNGKQTARPAVRWNISDGRTIALTALSVALAILLSRGFSSQFTLWILPFVALLLPGLDGALLGTALMFNNVLVEDFIYIAVFPTQHWLLWSTITMRSILLLWIALESAARIVPGVGAFWRSARQRLAWPVAAVALLGLVFAGTQLAPIIQARALTSNPESAAIQAIRKSDPQTAIVLTQPIVHDEISALVRPRPEILVNEPKFLEWRGNRSLYRTLQRGLNGHPRALLLFDKNVPGSSLDSAVRDWLAAHYTAGPPQQLGSVTITPFQQLSPTAITNIGADYGGLLQLVGVYLAGCSGQSSHLCAVRFEWQALQKIRRDYSISLQMLGPSGKLVAQHDAMPFENHFPTSDWHAGETVPDRVVLTLPSSLPTGRYELIAVVYDYTTKQRLRVRQGGQQRDYARLGAVTIHAR